MKPRVFTRIVRGWLRLMGCGWCGTCHQAVPLDLMTKTGTNPRRNSPRCKACVAASTRKYNYSNPEAIRAWQAANKDKMREYSRRWWQKNRLEGNRAARERYAAKHPVRKKRGRPKTPHKREVFRSRCFVCGRAFVHRGTRTTCSDACRLRKLRGERLDEKRMAG